MYTRQILVKVKQLLKYLISCIMVVLADSNTAVKPAEGLAVTSLVERFKSSETPKEAEDDEDISLH